MGDIHGHVLKMSRKAQSKCKRTGRNSERAMGASGSDRIRKSFIDYPRFSVDESLRIS